jgi:hypothetical protein
MEKLFIGMMLIGHDAIPWSEMYKLSRRRGQAQANCPRNMAARRRKPQGGFTSSVDMMSNSNHEPLVPGADPNPASPDHAPIKSTIEARAAITLGTMRWVLIVSLAVVAVVLVVLWAIAVQH